jgi:hypothetical protein
MGLFKTNHHHHHTNNVPYTKNVKVTVNEHRAVTDKSVELLNEFQKKARENLIYSIDIDQNNLKAVVLYYKDDIMNHRVHFHVKFELNGVVTLVSDYVDKFDWEKELSKNSYDGFNNEIIFKVVHKKLSEMIALSLMQQSPDFINSIKQ